MESSFHYPPAKRPIYTASTTMHELHTNYNGPIHPTSSDNDGGALSIRSKHPQLRLYIPPGHVAFRLICQASRVGGLIGKSGSIVKHLQQLTNSKIRVEDPNNSADHRVVTVISSPLISNKITLHATVVKQEIGKSSGGGEIGDGDEWFEVSAAQEGMVRVFEKVVEAAEGDAVATAAIKGMVSCRLLVGKNQVGAVIGKGGKVVEKIRKDTGSRIKVLTPEKLPSFVLPMDEIVEIEGDVLAVKKALVAVTGRLQEFPPVEKTRMHGARPFKVESLPVSMVDLSLQQSPMLQPMPSNSMNHALGGDPLPSGPEKVSTMDSRTPQQEVVFKILCPNDRVGAVIGKGGSIVRTLQSETGASICIGPTLTECDERLITIIAMENVETQYSPAQKAAVLVFNRSMDAGVDKGWGSGSKGSPVSSRVVVPSNQVGCLLGKGGAIISEMRKVTGTGIQIIGGNQVPKCASENDEVVQITGEFVNVQDALYKVTGRLRDNILSIKSSIVCVTRSSLRTENSPHVRARDPPPLGLHQSFGISGNLNEHKSSTQSMVRPGISYNIDRPLSPSLLASLTVSGVNQGSAQDIGRKLPSIKGGVELGSGSKSAIVEIVVPDNVIGCIYGKNGSNLARLRQISGAKVVVHEPRPGTTDRIVIISGTPDETQSAQSLLQAFILSGSS